jgi:hypothetical protein
VGDEAFRELSQIDPKANDLLNEVKIPYLSPAIFCARTVMNSLSFSRQWNKTKVMNGLQRKRRNKN